MEISPFDRDINRQFPITIYKLLHLILNEIILQDLINRRSFPLILIQQSPK